MTLEQLEQERRRKINELAGSGLSNDQLQKELAELNAEIATKRTEFIQGLLKSTTEGLSARLRKVRQENMRAIHECLEKHNDKLIRGVQNIGK